jgi:epoxyqueuosine reductase
MDASAPASNPSRLALQKARALGFDAVGIASAAPPLEQDFERYRAMLEASMEGSMRYLAENAEARRSVAGPEILEGAKSVICVARRYQRTTEDEDPPLARLVARYARGHDYHNGVRKKLRRLAAFVRTLGEDVQARPLCDEEPVLERAWAARAGLGFVGKNGMLIVPGEGSYVLLGEVVTTLALEAGSPIPERCGSCARCLEACPTSAFVRPFVLDPRRCVSYLTIEQPDDIPEPLRAGVGAHLFGCDDCQTVCPFNLGHRHGGRTAMFEPLERWSTLTLVDLLAPDLASRWADIAEGSPLFRAGPNGLARNAAVVLGNRRELCALPALRRAAEEHPSPVVRRAAAWASGCIER